MRMKLIAAVVAGLFASGSALAADDYFGGFVWQGSATLGGRGTNTDGGTRNGAYGTSSATLTPYQGPEDVAKAQEYQDTQSGVIGVIDLIGGSRGYYLRGFGENFGRDDQYINVVGGGYDSFKAQIYSDNIPHNLSFNALTPLQNSGTALMTNPGTPPYPPARFPGGWNTFNYSIQRDTVGGNIEVSAGTPFYVRGDYNEVTMTGIRPGSGQLGTGSGNGLIEFGIPTDFKTQEHDDRGGLRREGVERQAAVPRQQVHQRRAEHAVDQLLHAERARQLAARAGQRPAEVDAERRVEGPAVGFGDQLPRDAEQPHQQHRRRGHQPEADRQPVASDWRRLSEHRAQRVDVRRRHQDYDGQRVVGGHAVQGLRLARSTTSTTTSRTARRRSRMPRAVCPRPTRAAAPARRSSASRALAGARTTSSTRRTRTASTSTTGSTRARRSSAQYNYVQIDRQLEPADRVDAQPRVDRVPQHEVGELERTPALPVPAAAVGPQPLGDQQRRQRPADLGAVLLRGVRRQQLRPEHGPAQRRLDAGAAAVDRLRRHVARHRLQGQLLRPHGRQHPALRPVDQLRRSGQVPHLGDRQLRRGEVRPEVSQHGSSTAGPGPAAGRRHEQHELQLGHGKHAGELAASRCWPTGSRWTTSG